MNNKFPDARARTEADYMLKIGQAVSVIAGLIGENAHRQDVDEQTFLNNWHIGGLTSALDLLGHDLMERGENILETLDGQ